MTVYIYIYLEEESDEDVDFIEDKESSGSESDEDIRPERDEQKERVPRAGRKYLYGKNGHKWCREAPESRGRRSRIVLHLPGLKQSCQAESPNEFRNLLFTDNIIDIILKYTNAEIELFRDSAEQDFSGNYRYICR